MSHTYRPSGTGVVLVDVELDRLQRALNNAQSEFYLQPLHVEPAKRKAGMVVYADGTDWNPGAGEGLYRYSIAGAWVFIG